jgi:F-type H+-transporting ATPase subunit a
MDLLQGWNPGTILPNLLAWGGGAAEEAAHGAAEHGAKHEPGFAWKMVVVAIIIGIIMGLLTVARSGYKERVFKNPITQCAEQLYLFLQQLALGIIGKHGRKYLPMVATYWLFIFVSCIFGLFFNWTPTADLSLNLGLAITAIAYVQWEGIKANGVAGHFSHFAGPKLGGIMVIVSGMIFLIEIISEAMKLLSLSLRLYGNIHGGHEVLLNLNNLGKLSFGQYDAYIPVGGLLLPIKLLTCLVQALVFSLLFCVYIGLVTSHEEH